MKKLKCTFNRIDTEAESLQVQCRGAPTLTSNKEEENVDYSVELVDEE